MSEQERIEFRAKLRIGFDKARYKLVREKALHDYMIVEGDDNGGVRVIPARQVLREVYGEEVVTIVPIKKESKNE